MRVCACAMRRTLWCLVERSTAAPVFSLLGTDIVYTAYFARVTRRCSYLACQRYIYETHGMRGFWVGYSACLIRGMPWLVGWLVGWLVALGRMSALVFLRLGWLITGSSVGGE